MAAVAFARVANAFQRRGQEELRLAAVRLGRPADPVATIRARAAELGLPVDSMQVTQFGGASIRGERGGFLWFDPDERFERFSTGALGASSPRAFVGPFSEADFAAKASTYLERVSRIPAEQLFVETVTVTGGARSGQNQPAEEPIDVTVAFGLAWDGWPVLDHARVLVGLDGAGVVHRHVFLRGFPVEFLPLGSLVSPSEAESRVLARERAIVAAGCRIVRVEFGYPLLAVQQGQTVAVPVYRFHFDWPEDAHDRPWSCRFEDEPVTDDPQIREALARERQLPEW